MSTDGGVTGSCERDCQPGTVVPLKVSLLYGARMTFGVGVRIKGERERGRERASERERGSETALFRVEHVFQVVGKAGVGLVH